MSVRYDVPFSIGTTSLEVLTTALRAAVAGTVGEAPLIMDQCINWSELIHAARLGKLLGLAQWGFDRLGYSAPDEFRQAAAASRYAAFTMNSVNLSTIGKVTSIMMRDNIEFIMYKGPLLQQQLYGDLFLRSSTDIDLLVHSLDFERAGKSLIAHDYVLPPECRSLWWRHFLGEQHFFSRQKGVATVDLHHRVQQPGAPAPRHMSTFFSCPRWTRVGSWEVPVLSATNTALISAMSLVKAVVLREPAGAYVCDFAKAVLAMDEAGRESLRAQADRQALGETLAFAGYCAATVLRLPMAPFAQQKTDDFGCLAQNVSPMLFSPRCPDVRRPRLRQFMWELSDGRAFGRKLGNYARESVNQTASRLCHNWYKRFPVPPN
jgi:hypothetical protein